MLKNTKKLAIVIPAYKIKFLEETLESIACQSCKDFTLYIGDDCSPYDIHSIVSKFKDRMDLKYIKFNSNLGGIDLVSQWERCINMTDNEEWIWLFSDDDIMDSNCVEAFYSEIRKSNQIYLYHFNIGQIDESSNINRIFPEFPFEISSQDFFVKRASNEISSFVVEYIFNRQAYLQHNGFQNFDLAWGSDHATWIKFASQTSIKTIKGPKVYWRYSSENISPNKGDITLNNRKIKASANYYLWTKSFFKSNGNDSISPIFFMKCFLNDSKAYNTKGVWLTMKNEISKICSELELNSWIYTKYMYIHRLYKRLKNV